MSREPSPLLGHGPIQSNAWLRAAENISPRPKRARRWLKSQIDCHSEVRSSNTGGHETDYDAVANLHLPESPRSSYIGPKHRKRSIQQHSESPNLPCTNPPISFVPRPGAFAQKLNPEEFLSLVDGINFMDRQVKKWAEECFYGARRCSIQRKKASSQKARVSAHTAHKVSFGLSSVEIAAYVEEHSQEEAEGFTDVQ